MAYNNGFPIGYQPYPQYALPQTPIQTPQTVNTAVNNTSNGIVWVQGEAGAKAYPVAAGNTVMMLDSESSVFYIKSTAANGMPQPLRIFDFTERTANNNTDYVTRKEFEELKAALKGVDNNGKSINGANGEQSAERHADVSTVQG